jgi:hypothetical protein
MGISIKNIINIDDLRIIYLSLIGITPKPLAPVTGKAGRDL